VLILVRHALPDVVPDVPPHEWVLAADGLAAARELRFPAGALLVSSEEPKAFQTIESAGVVAKDSRFNEVSRTGEPFGGNWRELRRAYVGGRDHDDWEPRVEVAARFDAAISEHRDFASAAPLVVATHGMAMTVWLDDRIGLANSVDFWAELRLPDVIVVDLENASWRRG
jgi:broad specificity phosphatase PhoE